MLSQETITNKLTLEKISEYTESFAKKLNEAITQIDQINSRAHVLAVNASIEAAKSGTAGLAFGVVASHMTELSENTTNITAKMRDEIRQEIIKLGQDIAFQAKEHRGEKLCNLALVNIDLIDRNLFERSADVRWWATNSSIIKSLTDTNEESTNRASNRLERILKAYTVYYDLVIANTQGKLISNGNMQFHSVGSDVSKSDWFVSAMKTTNGDQFGFQTVHRSTLVNNNLAVVYSCAVREKGDPHGKILGVLGVIVKWESLAQTIIQNTPLDSEEKKKTRVCIADTEGTVLADSEGKILSDVLVFTEKVDLFAKRKDFIYRNDDGVAACFAHARSPGFEGYSTGWHSLIIQKI